jgi:hypothetical protein
MKAAYGVELAENQFVKQKTNSMLARFTDRKSMKHLL